MDLEGKVIAINSAIIPFAQGIGFAIPINSAKKAGLIVVMDKCVMVEHKRFF